jgi:hypothetical protein
VLYSSHNGPIRPDPHRTWADFRLAIWDRMTGRAALCYASSRTSGGSVPGRDAFSRPFVTWGENGNLILLDLRALG